MDVCFFRAAATTKYRNSSNFDNEYICCQMKSPSSLLLLVWALHYLWCNRLSHINKK